MATIIQKDVRKLAIRRMADGFRQFARNGRWGTCVDCPRDSAGHGYPEFCRFTARHDHQLTATSLAEQFEIDLREKSRVLEQEEG